MEKALAGSAGGSGRIGGRQRHLSLIGGAGRANGVEPCLNRRQVFDPVTFSLGDVGRSIGATLWVGDQSPSRAILANTDGSLISATPKNNASTADRVKV